MAGRKILVVEDEEGLRRLIRLVLEEHGYEVTVAADGREGLERALAQRPDLIILDVLMPRMSGYAVCEAIKAEATLKSMPILIITGKKGEAYEAMGKSLGADSFLAKPFEMEALLKHVAALLRE